MLITISQVNIELIMIEVSHSNQAEIDKTLMSAGYEVYKKLKNQDIIYKKVKSVWSRAEKTTTGLALDRDKPDIKYEKIYYNTAWSIHFNVLYTDFKFCG